MGQFARTLIIADAGSRVHYILGGSAPTCTSGSLPAVVVEVIAKPSARVTYTTIQNCSDNVVTLVTKRARVEAKGHMGWIARIARSRPSAKNPVGCATMVAMPMRQDCKYFESRSYPNGDTVRKCDLDLAPEAPWRCPEDCPKYTRRLADVNWAHGTLVTPETPPEPESLGDDDSIAALLDAAEDIINEAVPSTLADLEEERRKRQGGRMRRALRKSGTPKSPKAASKPEPKPKPKRGTGEGLGERFRRRYRDGR